MRFLTLSFIYFIGVITKSLDTLPIDVIHEIMTLISFKDAYNLAAACKWDKIRSSILDGTCINPLLYHSSKYPNDDIQQLLDSHELSLKHLKLLQRNNYIYSYQILKYLIKNRKYSYFSRLDTKGLEEISFIYASEYGIQEIVEDLIYKHHVNPGSRGNLAFLLACQNGHASIVKKLLEFVDPTIPDHLSLQLAAQNGHYDVVKDLLEDRRVDPNWDNYIAALRAFQNHFTDIVDLIAMDERTDLEYFESIVRSPIYVIIFNSVGLIGMLVFIIQIIQGEILEFKAYGVTLK